MFCYRTISLEMCVNVIVFHVKEMTIIIFVEVLVVEVVVAMEHVPVLMDGLVQHVTVLQIGVNVLIQVL